MSLGKWKWSSWQTSSVAYGGVYFAFCKVFRNMYAAEAWAIVTSSLFIPCLSQFRNTDFFQYIHWRWKGGELLGTCWLHWGHRALTHCALIFHYGGTLGHRSISSHCAKIQMKWNIFSCPLLRVCLEIVFLQSELNFSIDLLGSHRRSVVHEWLWKSVQCGEIMFYHRSVLWSCSTILLTLLWERSDIGIWQGQPIFGNIKITGIIHPALLNSIFLPHL